MPTWLRVVSSIIYLKTDAAPWSRPNVPYSMSKQQLTDSNIRKVLVEDLEIIAAVEEADLHE